MRHRLAFVTLAGLASALSAACSGGDSITLGAVLPLTGESAYWGENIRNGIDLALEEVNSAGGVLGRPLRVVYEDSQGRPQIGLQAFEKLTSFDRAEAVIGDVISTVILAIAPVANRKNVVLLGFGEAAAITQAGEYIFRNWNSAASDAEVTANFAATQSLRIAVLFRNDAFGQSAASLFVSAVKQGGSEVVLEEGFSPTTTDFRPLIARIRRTQHDGIYLAGYHEEALEFLRQLSEAGAQDVPLYGVSSWENEDLINFAAAAYPGRVFYGYPRPPDATAQEVLHFRRAYRERYAKEPEILADNGYDALWMLANAINSAGTYDGAAIKDALYALGTFRGASGTMEFDRNGDVHKPFGLKRVDRDGWVWLDPVDGAVR